MRNLIVIINWNNQEDTEACLNSLIPFISINLEILLIDNNSADTEWIKNNWSDYEYIQHIFNDENLGFTRASNQGFHYALEKEHEYITFLNNDTIVKNDFCETLNSILVEKSPDMLSCKLLQADEPQLLDNVGHKMINTGEIVPIGHGHNHNLFKVPFRNLGSCAAATSYSMKMVQDIGYYDLYFDTGYEDAEFGLRAFIAGYESWYIPDLIVYHKISRSVSRVDNIKYRVRQQMNIYYSYFKLIPFPVMVLNVPFIFIKYFLVILMELVLFRWSYISIHFKTLGGLIRDRLKISRARKEFYRNRSVVSSVTMLKKQEFFLFFDTKRLIRYTIGKKTNVFDRSKRNE